MSPKEMAHVILLARRAANTERYEDGNLRGSMLWSFLEMDLEIRVLKMEERKPFLFLAMEMYVFYSTNHKFGKLQKHCILEIKLGYSPK